VAGEEQVVATADDDRPVLVPRSFVHRALRNAGGMLLRPWPKRRIRMARIVLVPLLVLGPIAVTVGVVFLVPDQPGAPVFEGLQLEGDRTLLIRATIRNPQPSRGDITLQLAFSPGGALTDPADNVTLTEEVRVLLSDGGVGGQGGGNTVYTFPAGEPMRPVEATLRLWGGSPTRYPFDVYDVQFSVAASSGPVDTSQALPFSMPTDAILEGYDVTEAFTRPVGFAGLEGIQVTISRGVGVQVWSVTFMVLAWMLAIGAALAVWTAIVYGAEVPFWAWGFLTGVLFALPALRNGLPGSPPYGSLVDWSSFYWAIALVSLSVIALLANWNLLVRQQLRAAAREAAAEST
jgi:hypothetical protein